ncbi:hypothetical protein HGM15179_020661 [Zosterops borbonicus]|uniref:Uncharacterized protein n=1 Tax=Zosterops borbonicus TaxID=364589 RepID=A0A8K1D8T1_9PASS|nr:hypothetical protein HGM15179_020661 [Zosterops borbonicus]
MLWLELLVLNIVLTQGVNGVLNVDQRENMWVTWANRTGQDSFCLSLATPSSLFRTCLIGVPLRSMTELKKWTQAKIYSNLSEAWNAWCDRPIGSTRNHSETWCEVHEIQQNDLGAQVVAIAQDLKVISTEPQEFDLLGSVPGNYCLMFGHARQSKAGNTWLFTKSPLYYSYAEYCNNWTQLEAPTQDAARKLPPGIFLICGNRAWSAVPKRAAGGPCYFGKLSLFAPSLHQITRFSKAPR